MSAPNGSNKLVDDDDCRIAKPLGKFAAAIAPAGIVHHGEKMIFF